MGENTPIGTALFALRTSAGMTLEEVAAEAGVSVSYLSRAERGLATPTAQWVHIIASTIGEHIALKPAV